MKWTGSQWVAVGGIAFLILLAVYAALNSFPDRRGDVAMNSAEHAQELAKAGKREQVITFTTGMTPLDRTKTADASLYVIGVGQYTLGEAEQIEVYRYSSRRTYRGFSGNSSWGLYGDDYSASNTVDGPFNNLLIYDTRTGSSGKIFDTRISVSKFTVFGTTNPPALAIFAASADSNHDERLDGDDLQDLYIYTSSDRVLHKIESLDASAENVISVSGVNFLVIQGAVDKNKDGKITSRTDGNEEVEQRFLYRIDLHSFLATPMLPAELTKSLQDTLDGVAPTAAPK